MKLNKLQRHTAYILMLDRADNMTDRQKMTDGLCWFSCSLFYLWDEVFDFTYALDLFPELLNKKPKNCDRFWFPKNRDGWEKRKDLLRQCIEETY